MVEEWMWLVWLVIFVASLILEAATAAVVSIWFAAGGLVALILSFFNGAVPYWGQIIVFFGVSLVCFVCLRPFFRKWSSKKERIDSNVSSLVGRKGVIITGCDFLHVGEMMLSGVVWSCITYDEHLSFVEGEIAKVAGIEGNKIIVEKVEVARKGQEE